MEEFVNDKVYDENEKNDEEKEENETTDSERTKIDQGKGVNDERGGDYVALFEETEFSSRTSSEYLNEKYYSVGEFYFSTCSGDRFYDIFDKEEEIITEGSIFWVNTNKTIWEGKVIKNLLVIFQRMPNI